jgi:hypothetical protein
VLGVTWAYSFVKRCPELRARYNRRITYQRAKQENPKVIKQWFETVHGAIQEHGIHEDAGASNCVGMGEEAWCRQAKGGSGEVICVLSMPESIL